MGVASHICAATLNEIV